jgi:CDP-6-deoxy-D-xylo-4-hexulose-3-dehydrase
MIPLMKNAFLREYETKKELADFIIRAPRLSMGDACFEFEGKFAEFQHRRECILFNSGSSANLAMMQSLLNLGLLHKGDKVGFSALTWSTNVMPIIQLGMEPVPIDCKVETLNVMSDTLEQSLHKEKIKAIFITNALGFAGDLDNIRDICNNRKIILIEDNCEALGTELSHRKTGNFGVAASFSFFVAHHMSTIEGGCVCTDDHDIAEMLRIVRANGWDRNLKAAQQRKWRDKFGIKSEFEAKYTFYDLAYNFRPTEITGFLGLTQLQYLEENCRIRERNHILLEEEVKRNSDLIPINYSHISKLSPFAFPVVCKSKDLRDKYLSQFSGAGVEIRPMIAGNMVHQPFYSKYVAKRHSLPNTDFIHDCGFYCGNYPELSANDLETLSICLQSYS